MSVSIEALHPQLTAIHQRVYRESPLSCRFVLASNGRRLINLRLLRRPRRAWKWLEMRDDGDGDMRRWRRFLTLCRRAIKRSYVLPCSADIILLGANLNLFYLDAKLRVKCVSSIRSREHLQNEITARRAVEATNTLHVPEIVDVEVEREPFLLVDRLIDGERLGWRHPRARAQVEAILPVLWRRYRAQGIEWQLLGPEGFDLMGLWERYQTALAHHPGGLRFDFRWEHLQGFAQRHVPTTVIHGDLTIHNLIRFGNDVYLLDWELARRDWLIDEFTALLLIPEWKMAELLRPFMQREISDRFGDAHERALGLDEQVYLVLLRNVCHALEDPSKAHMAALYESQVREYFACAR